MVWQVAAAVTAQPYLTDISQDLKKIRDGIGQIQRWLSNERVASLEASAKMLSEIEIGLARDKGFLSKNLYYQGALAEIDRDCSKIARACVRDLQDYVSEIQKAELSAVWRTDGIPLRDLLPKVSAAAEAGIFALTMRVLNTGLLFSFLDDLSISKFRVDDIKSVQMELFNSLQSFRSEANKRIDALTEWLSRRATINERKAEFRQATEQELRQIEQRIDIIRRALETCERSFGDLSSMLDRPLTLDVEITDGGISPGMMRAS
jgi:hypothetical protein